MFIASDTSFHFPQMQTQDAEQFPHGAGTAVDAVSGMDDHFAFGVVEMAAGVRHHAVGPARMVGLFLVADDRMINNSFLYGGIREGLDEKGIRVEVIEAGDGRAAVFISSFAV